MEAHLVTVETESSDVGINIGAFLHRLQRRIMDPLRAFIFLNLDDQSSTTA
jgi:hypothetical protein